jgi:POT family proton-dependent oligopeptide transporter
MQTLIYSCSLFFERASYYGFRAILILYMIGETLNMDRTEAFSVYGTLTGSFIISKIIGAIFGDLVTGNRIATIIGGVTQAIGIFSLCVSSTFGLYVGLFLIVLGNGFYSPNITALFGKNYLNTIKLLDSGFTLYYLVINIAATAGILLIGYIGERLGFNYGFIIAGILMLFSTVLMLFSKTPQNTTNETSPVSTDIKAIKIIAVVILLTLFWGIYEISASHIYTLQTQLKEFSTGLIHESFSGYLNAIFIFPIGIIASILWYTIYTSQSFKLALGFFFGALAFGVLLLIPEIPTEEHLFVYISAIGLLSISEICIAPILYSVLTQYANPKYLAIFISLTAVPTYGVILIIGRLTDYFYNNPKAAMSLSLIIMGGLSILLLVYTLFIRKLITARKQE